MCQNNVKKWNSCLYSNINTVRQRLHFLHSPTTFLSLNNFFLFKCCVSKKTHWWFENLKLQTNFKMPLVIFKKADANCNQMLMASVSHSNIILNPNSLFSFSRHPTRNVGWVCKTKKHASLCQDVPVIPSGNDLLCICGPQWQWQSAWTAHSRCTSHTLTSHMGWSSLVQPVKTKTWSTPNITLNLRHLTHFPLAQ